MFHLPPKLIPKPIPEPPLDRAPYTHNREELLRVASCVAAGLAQRYDYWEMPRNQRDGQQVTLGMEAVEIAEQVIRFANIAMQKTESKSSKQELDQ